MQLQDVDDIIDEYTGLCRTALDYSMIVKQVVDSAKKPDFDAESWAPLAALADTDRFKRVGNFKEVMDWPTYIGFLTNWAPTAEWECSFKRVTEKGALVFLELEERTSVAGFNSVVNSLSVYAFNKAGLITHVDVYLQMELPPAEMLQSYEERI